LGITTQTVTARAVAFWGSGISKNCVFTLGSPGSGPEGITASGDPTLNAPTCGIDDNGDFNTAGGAQITAGSIGIAGADTNDNGATPKPIKGIAPAGDPLSYLTPPCETCDANTNLRISSDKTVSAGNYKSISITDGNVTFNSGIYVIGSGGLTINGDATVTGTGVTFYITNGGSVTINGTTNVKFSAPTSGSYEGILFYQDRNDTSPAKINGTSSSSFQGALYFPNALLDFGGTDATFNSSADYTVIVSRALNVSGTAAININSDFSGLADGSPIHSTVLVE
jgi:hypothetical protein